MAGDEALVKVFVAHQQGRLIARGQWMLDKRKSLRVPDMAQDPDRPYTGSVKATDLHGFLGAPLLGKQQRPLGLIHVMTRLPREFSERELNLIGQLANGATIAIENATLLQELRDKSQELQHTNSRLNRLLQEQSALREIFTQINLLDSDSLLHQLTERALKLLNVEHAQVRLLGKDGSLRRLAVAGKWSDRLPERQNLSSGRSNWVMTNKKPLAIKDISKDKIFGPGHFLREVGVKSYLLVPLISRKQKSIGVLGAASLTEREFTAEEISLAEQLAAGSAIAIENARLFEEVQQKSHELEEAYTAKSKFLNTMAHELRTPLHVVVGTQQLLLEGAYGALPEHSKKGLEIIGRQAVHLVDLTNEILDLARLEAKRVPLSIDEFAIEEIMTDLESSFMPLVQGKGLKLIFNGRNNNLTMRSDKQKIKLILQNLLGNAVKYTDKGNVEVQVLAESSRQPPGNRQKTVSIAIKDTGIGISKADLPHIFEAFYMAEGVDRNKNPSSGLGLSIVGRLVELLNGEIRVESELGKGTTFWVTLPLIHPAEA